MLQRLCGLGTIYLGTLATGSGAPANPFPRSTTAASGVTVPDVPDPEAAYAAIRCRIDESKSARLRGGGISRETAGLSSDPRRKPALGLTFGEEVVDHRGRHLLDLAR